MGENKMFMPYDLRPTIEITAFILAGLSTVVVGVRFYSRIWVVGSPKLSDYIMAAALLCTWALCACNHYQLVFGSGAQDLPKDVPQIGTKERDEYMKNWLFGSAVTFYLGFATQRTFRILVRAGIVIVPAVSVVAIFIVAFQCPKIPSYAFSAGILRDRGVAHCFDLRIVFYWQAGWSLATDVMILLLPMPLLFSLRMRTLKRLSIVAVFAVSLLIPIASAVRIWALSLWANSGSHARYYGGYIIFWSQVEINTAIICASAPSLQPLIKRVFSKLSLFQQSRGPYYYYGGRNSLPGLPVVKVERIVRRDSISILESPTLAHCSSEKKADDGIQTTVMVMHSAEEEELKARVRAFSSPNSLYSPPASPASVYSTSTPWLRTNDTPRGG
ncbi:hypothetical protein BDW02DRAFT_582531 [Decorospora gaudefroyi]|uniref:Rhodopsin domain-containing protein n=1 Tax=Decorospora gaudefroyi TaxID=184978 RepID=A0A6A5K0M3_9PLEO|nr:hypothetical protein BDW02DRAFT_582531 [Decorospora gaudefroyi]